MKYIHIFTIFSTPESFFDGQFKFFADKGEEIIVVSSKNPKAIDFAKRNNIRFIPVEIPRALAPKAILNAIYKICKIIKIEKPDVVFGHTPVGALCAMIAAKFCGIKRRIYYRHGLIYTTMKGLKYQIFRLEEKFVASLATSVINVSHSLSNLAIKDRLNPSNKNNVIGYGTCGGIDAYNIFNPELLKEKIVLEKKNRLGLNNADIVFGFCGRLCIDKGVPEMIDGFMKLKEHYPSINCKLLLIGSFDERDILPQKTIDIITYNKDIIVTGWIDKADVPYYYFMLDVFVFPSHREGFGMCVIEASAMEKPILVSRSHGCVDSIVEHLTGEYVDLTADSISKGMELMLDDRKRKFYGKNGRKRVLEYYDFRVMWPLVDKLYNKILQQ